MNAFAVADEAPLRSFRARAVCKPGIPRQRHAHGATIDQIDDECIVGDDDLLC